MSKEAKDMARNIGDWYSSGTRTIGALQILIEQSIFDSTQPLNVVINELGNDLSDSEEEAERYLAELKQSNTWVSVEELPQKGGYYQVYNKYSGLPVVVYYGSRYPFSPMPPEKEMSFWEGNKKMSFRHKKFYRPLPTPPKQ